MKTKKIHIAIIIGIILSNYTPALADPGGDLPYCNPTDCAIAEETIGGTNCNQSTTQCYYKSYLVSCTTCPYGYTKKQQYAYPSGCQGNVEYFTCCKNTCSDCTSTGWTSVGAGYEKNITATCDCGECKKTTSYRCAAGYYGTTRNGSTGCTICPSSGNVAGQSVAGSNSAITSCYIPSGTTFSDSTGSGTYTGNCYYSN